MAKGGNKKVRQEIKDIAQLIFHVAVRQCKLCKNPFWARNGVNICDYCKPFIVYNLNTEICVDKSQANDLSIASHCKE